MKKSPLAAALAGLTMFATTATALPVHIDPGAYTGRYKVQGSGFTSGPSDYDLAPGDYSVELGASIGGSSFLFTVGPTGDVTSRLSTRRAPEPRSSRNSPT